MQDLQEVTQETHYENFRAEKLASGGIIKPKPGSVETTKLLKVLLNFWLCCVVLHLS